MKLVVIIILIFPSMIISQWTTIPHPVKFPSDIYFYDSLKGIILGQGDNWRSAIAHTVDGGKTWEKYERKHIGSNLYVFNDELMFCYGLGEIYRSIDQGLTWNSVVPEDHLPQFLDLDFFL